MTYDHDMTMYKDLQARKLSLFNDTSTRVLIQSALALEGKITTSPDERMTRAWIYDEIERRVGLITMEEGAKFEEIYDTTDSYMTALIALRPELEKV